MAKNDTIKNEENIALVLLVKAVLTELKETKEVLHSRECMIEYWREHADNFKEELDSTQAKLKEAQQKLDDLTLNRKD